MDDATLAILIIALAGLLTALGTAVKHIYSCKGCCCNSECTKDPSEVIPINSQSNSHICPSSQRPSMMTLSVPQIDDYVNIPINDGEQSPSRRSRSVSFPSSPALTRKVSWQSDLPTYRKETESII